jgi:hypothetical protein
MIILAHMNRYLSGSYSSVVVTTEEAQRRGFSVPSQSSAGQLWRLPVRTEQTHESEQTQESEQSHESEQTIVHQ